MEKEIQKEIGEVVREYRNRPPLTREHHGEWLEERLQKALTKAYKIGHKDALSGVYVTKNLK